MHIIVDAQGWIIQSWLLLVAAPAQTKPRHLCMVANPALATMPSPPTEQPHCSPLLRAWWRWRAPALAAPAWPLLCTMPPGRCRCSPLQVGASSRWGRLSAAASNSPAIAALGGCSWGQPHPNRCMPGIIRRSHPPFALPLTHFRFMPGATGRSHPPFALHPPHPPTHPPTHPPSLPSSLPHLPPPVAATILSSSRPLSLQRWPLSRCWVMARRASASGSGT